MTEMHASTAESAPGVSSTPLDKGMLSSLFDLSFTTFVTPKLIQLIFTALLALSALGTLLLIGTAFAQSTTVGILVLVGSPVIFGLYVLSARIGLELVIVIFRIYELLRERPLR